MGDKRPRPTLLLEMLSLRRKASNHSGADCEQDEIRMPHMPRPEKEIRGKRCIVKMKVGEKEKRPRIWLKS